MFELPSATEVANETRSAEAERNIDWLIASVQNRGIALAQLISDQMEDDEEWQELLADAPRSLTRGVMSVDSFDANLSSLEDAGIEDTRATDKECESDLDSFLPVWQELLSETIQSQLG